MFSFLKRRRRARIAAEPFPEAWGRILRRRVPYFSTLSAPDRERLERHIQVFIAEKTFEGCDGFKITDDVRVIIAAYACVLILHRPNDYYPGLQTVLIYPEAFHVPLEEEGPDGVVGFDSDERAGESWDRGAVILAWEEIQLSGKDGYNVVLHEFAHQIDFAHRTPEREPAAAPGPAIEEWGEVLGQAYAKFVNDVENNRRTLIDDYGAENEAEFFAVATETFFERPIAMERRHPDLYNALRTFYAQDPAALQRGKQI